MADMINVSAHMQNGITQVKLKVRHSMEDGQRTDKKTGQIISAKFLREIKVMHEGKPVFAANLSTAIAENPFLAFSFSGGATGETLTISWVENTGKSGSQTAKIE
ncbi:sulfur-oxidizing protein SoxZ [Amphritea atlantica]|uniref:Sulfur-oxidizing protein SoxZ n=1 Tax=Amphritea atlantica TaxID=355243 RepID=A0A1H9G0Z3_9GAMM|nr:thiosulfate oxidation carrier complex protein SoxZ [Amphritea atlantica]SEQ43764.1 sulfur-oxidizing protein SoxZ [Amphritea atlantica]